MDESISESSADAPSVLEPGATEPRRRRWLIPVLVAPVVLVVLVVVAWAVDTSLGGVPRNVRLAGTDIGRLSEDELSARVSSAAKAFGDTKIVIASGDTTYDTTAQALGLMVDEDRTTARALDVDREGSVLLRPFRWARSFLTPRVAPLEFQISEEKVSTAIADLEGDARTPPTEPALDVVDGTLHVVAGRDGRGIDAARVAADLPAAAARADPGETIHLRATRGSIAPAISAEEARAAASEAELLASEPLEVATTGGSRTISPEALRTWMQLTPAPDGSVGVGLDAAKVAAGLRYAFSGIEGGPVDASFTVDDGVPVIRPDRPGRICCTSAATETINTALHAGERRVELELLEDGPAWFTVLDARAWGITQAVGGNHAWRDGAATTAGPGFTTYHAATGARVTNIHRIADLVRGAVVPPGESFSINDYVGKRTLEKGFVFAGAISNGEHVDEIGGGISQFATTTFNAAYFAGLDIDEYQAHSEYFDRYPRGREATMGYPHPDLKFTNNTPYGILIWTSYTNTSLTVTLYSTPYATAEQTGITEGTSGRCAVVTTTRTRTFPDGRTENDKFRARYRPGPGQGC
ncbi:MAG: VanW family protein [Microthrixaceae bacterium]